jgi:hypothetical protein
MTDIPARAPPPPPGVDRRSEKMCTTMTTVDRSLRGARAAVFAAVCVGLTAAGHVWMSGEAVPLWSVALALAVLTGAGYALAGRQRGFLSISALMLVGELGQHLLFRAAQDATASSSAASVPALPRFLSGRVLPLSDWICGMASSSASASGMAARGDGSFGARLAADLMTGQAGHDAIGMIAAHAVAGLLCAWWLRCGEVAVFQLLRWLATLAAPALLLLWPGTLVVPDSLPRAATIAPRDDRALTRYKQLLSRLVVRRGPPSVTCLCAF